MTNFENILNFLQGKAVTCREILSDLGSQLQGLYNKVGSWADKVAGVFSSLQERIIGNYKDIEDVINNIGTNQQLNIEDGEYNLVLTIEGTGDIKKLKFGSEEALIINTSSKTVSFNNDFNIHNVEVIGNDNELHRTDGIPLLKNAFNGNALDSVLATFCTRCSKVDDEASDFQSKAITKIEALFGSFSSMKETLSQATNSGIESLTTTILTIIPQIKSVAEAAIPQAEDKNPFESDTHIQLAEFAPGMLLSGLGALTSALGAIIAAIVPIWGVIIQIIGYVIMGITAVVNYALEYSGTTNFTIKTNGSGYFDFVVKRGEYPARPSEIEYFTLLDTRSFTIHSCHLPIVRLVYITELNGVYTVHYEDHLSCDFDITKNLSVIQGALVGISNYSYVLYDEHSGLVFLKSMLSNGHPCYIPALKQINKLFGVEDAYYPISFKFSDKLQSLINQQFQDYIWLRLASAVFIYAYMCMGGVNLYFKIPSNQTYQPIPYIYNKYWWNGIGTTGGSDTDYSDGNNHYSTVYFALMSLMNTAASVIQTYFMKGNDPTNQSYSSSNISLDRSCTDKLLEVIFNCFDGLPTLSNTFAPSGVFQLLRTDNFQSQTFNSIDITDTVRPDFNSDFIRYQTYGTTDYEYINTMPGPDGYSATTVENRPAVKIPVIKWAAFVSGLIVDALIGTVIIAAVTAGVLGFKALIWKRTRMQNSVETAWYNYSDTLNDGTKKEQKEAWKKYKWARLKYNIMATFTGGTTMSKGLYDDDSESFPEMDNIETDISTVLTAITG